MARFKMDGLQPVIDEMRRLGEESGEAAQATLMAGAEEVRKAWKLAAEEWGLRDTGEMIESINYAKTPKNLGNARTIDIYPQGKDHKGVRNAEKAFILHYGTSKKQATHWVDDADAYCEVTVVPAMIKAWDEYMKLT